MPRPTARILAAALALGLLPCLQAEAQTATTLRTRLPSDIRSTDPGTNRDGPTDSVVQHMVEGLVAFKEDTSVGLLLAEKYEVSTDGKAYTFTLRPGIRFHNGATLGADDVLWSWKRFMEPATGWRCLSEFTGGIAKLESVTKKDERTVVFTFDRPSALILATMARPDCGGSAILHKDSVAADGKWVAPIGTGPFKQGEWKRGQYIELQRFDGYASRTEPRDGYTGAKKALVDRVRFSVIPDPTASKAALLTNALDIDFQIEPEDIADYKAKPDMRLDGMPSMLMTALIFQTRDPAVADVRIRKALALAIDTAEITSAVTGGTGKANNAMLPTSSPFYGKVQAEGYKQNVAEAKRLLAEAGYKGQPIKVLANKRFGATFDSAVLIQSAAEQVGLKIDIEVLDWATQLDRYNKGTYQAQVHPFSARLDPSLSYEMLTGPKATQPRKVWDDAEAIDMLRQSMETADRGKRQALFDSLHRRQMEQVPAVVLYNEVRVAAFRRNIEGYKGWPMASPRFWGVSLR